MSDLDALLANPFGLSEADRKALAGARKVVELASSVWGYANAAKSVLQTLGLLGNQPDPFDEIRESIDRIWTAFQGVVSALDANNSMRAVADQLADARAALQSLAEFAPEDASSSGTDPVWDGLRPLVITNSAKAVLAIGSPAYWQRVSVPELNYKRYPPGFTHPPHPPVSGGLVFDYRLSLPAYLEAICIRIVILAAVSPRESPAVRSELSSTASNLLAMHDIAAAGIRTLITPPSAFTGGMYDVQHWRTFNAPTGAVEIYSSLDQVAPWPESEYPLTPGSAADHDRWRHFLVRHAVRCWHRRRQLYRNVGLHEAFAVALNLRVLAREPGVAFQGTLGDYGVRDLAKTIDEADFLHTHQRLRPIGLKLLLTQLGEFGGDRPVSVRQAVTR